MQQIVLSAKSSATQQIEPVQQMQQIDLNGGGDPHSRYSQLTWMVTGKHPSA